MFKLFRRNITDWVSIEDSGRPDFLFSDQPTVADFVEFDTIENIAIAMNLDGNKSLINKVQIGSEIYYCDFKFCRDQIKTKFIDWSSHSNEEKAIFCYLLVLKALLTTKSLKYSGNKLFNFARHQGKISVKARSKIIFIDIFILFL